MKKYAIAAATVVAVLVVIKFVKGANIPMVSAALNKFA